MNTRSVQRTLLTSGLKSLSYGTLTDVQDPGMRTGPEYQAAIPDLNSETVSSGPGSVLLWQPTSVITDEEVDRYLKVAQEKHSYSSDQALGMLYYHSYDISKALVDLPNFCPVQEDWSMEDKVIFQQAYLYHGKNFQRIHSMLPDKPISGLVKYYYLWKRSYAQYSLMDKHSRKNGRRLGNGLPVNNDDADSSHSGSNRSLGEVPHILPSVQLVGKGKQLPKGIFISTGELASIDSDGVGVSFIKDLDGELQDWKVKVQQGKQDLSNMRDQISEMEDMVEFLRPPACFKKTYVPAKWTDEEIQMALEVIREHGKDAEMLSYAIPGKTITQCRNFFTNYKRKLNLPHLIAEYEQKHGHKPSRYSRQTEEHIQSAHDINPPPPTSNAVPPMVHQPTILGTRHSSHSPDMMGGDLFANKRPHMTEYVNSSGTYT